MTITFSDIPAAVRSYLADNVGVTLTENQQGTYTMTATNAAAPDGLALRNVVYHFESTRPDMVLLKVPRSTTLLCREHLGSAAPPVTSGIYVERMFVTYLEGDLGIGERHEIDVDIGLARTRGLRRDGSRSAICVHVHAELAEHALFPRRHGPTVGRIVDVA